MHGERRRNAMTPTEKLEAVEEIKRLRARYFRFVDTKDWDGLRGLFAPDARIDLSYAQTPTDHLLRPVAIDGAPQPINPQAVFGVDEFVATAKSSLGEAVSVHHGHMPEIEVTGEDSATGVWAMEDMIRWPETYVVRRLHGFGHYRETYVRLAQGWRIQTMQLTRLRNDTDPPGARVGAKVA
jgi:hypothetical protein